MKNEPRLLLLLNCFQNKQTKNTTTRNKQTNKNKTKPKKQNKKKENTGETWIKGYYNLVLRATC